MAINKNIEAKVDLGYMGIKKFHSNVEIPKKNSKFHKLTDKDKKENQEKASNRIYVEHINAKIKTFQILKQKYRNRRKRYNLRVNMNGSLKLSFTRSLIVLRQNPYPIRP